MARTFAMQVKLDFHYVFDIEQPVGVNCPNERSDTLLAQYLLAVWLTRMPYNEQIDSFLKGKVPVTIDGIFGNKTKAYIEAFEMWCNGPGSSRVVVDSKLHPMNGSGMGTESGATKKMWLLNQEFYFANGLRGGMPSTPIQFPMELKYYLYC